MPGTVKSFLIVFLLSRLIRWLAGATIRTGPQIEYKARSAVGRSGIWRKSLMDDRPETIDELPKYLLPLLEPRPSGEAKLLAAWDGLSVEHQVLLLEHLGRHGHLGWTNRIRGKALVSPNAYVRYLAAREFNPHDDNSEEAALKKRIDADPEALVRYAVLESDCFIRLPSEFSDAGAFFALPHEARLATVRSLPHRGEQIAALIRYAVENEMPSGRVTEEELVHLVLEYVTNPHFKSHYGREIGYDGYGEYLRGKDITALWSLVANVSERTSCVLIRNLPEESGTCTGIPDETLNGMTRRQLEILLERPEIGLKMLRKKIFFQSVGSEDEPSDPTDCLRVCAISHNFQLTNDEFAEVLARDEKKKAELLTDLARYASDLSLCILQAVHDVLRDTDWSKDADPHGLLWEAAVEADNRFSEKLARLKDCGREWEAHDWRLYGLAKRAVPWKKGEKGNLPSAELGFLAEHVKEGDTWGTSMAFSRAWEGNRWEVKIKGLDKLLQRRFPLTEEERQVYLEEDSVDREGDGEARDDEHNVKTEEAHKEIVPDIKKPLTKGDFRVWAISIEKFALARVGGLVVMSLGIVGIWKVASSVYAGKYWTALSWLPALLFCVLFYRSFHRWYYDLDWEQQRIRKTMSE